MLIAVQTSVTWLKPRIASKNNLEKGYNNQNLGDLQLIYVRIFG